MIEIFGGREQNKQGVNDTVGLENITKLQRRFRPIAFWWGNFA